MPRVSDVLALGSSFRVLPCCLLAVCTAPAPQLSNCFNGQLIYARANTRLRFDVVIPTLLSFTCQFFDDDLVH